MGDSVQSAASWGLLQYVSPCSYQPLGVRQWLQASSQLRTGDAKATPGLPGGRCGVPKNRGVAGLQRGAATLKQGEASAELLPGSQQSTRGQGGGRTAGDGGGGCCDLCNTCGNSWKKRCTECCHPEGSGSSRCETNPCRPNRILLRQAETQCTDVGASRTKQRC